MISKTKIITLMLFSIAITLLTVIIEFNQLNLILEYWKNIMSAGFNGIFP
ncbi:MAG: hypothetical protein ACP5GU_09535 [Thermoprotei archaeon]|jgi:hypothetical protein